MRRSPFDLENAIRAWRRGYTYRHAFSREDLNELEGHLRDQIDSLCAEGLPEHEAFAQAVRDIGDYATTEEEYGKVFWEKAWHHRRLWKELTWTATMLKNYLTITLRTLKRHPGYTFINVTGLAVGVACCLLILLYVRDELSYDRHHANADRIVRVALETRGGDGAWRGRARTFYRLAPMLEQALSPVRTSVRLAQSQALIRHGDRQFMDERILLADSTVFDVFTIPFVRGKPETALQTPYSAVLTESAARRYFGDEDPLGQTLTLHNDFEVTGIVEAMPATSHFHFDVLLAMDSMKDSYSPHTFESMGSQWAYTYLLLEQPMPVGTLEDQATAFIQEHIPPDMSVEMRLAVHPLTDIHLTAGFDSELEPGGTRTYLYLFSLIAVFILLIACINFMNLATARASRRATEVGIRKVVGAYRSQLIRQFLSEALLLSLGAVVLAVGLAALGLPLLNAVSGKSMTFGVVGRPAILLALLGIGVVVGIVSGSYPALFLSSFRPARVLKSGGIGTVGGGASWLRKGLVVFQFGISIVLIVGTLVVYRQLHFVQTMNLGFDREHVLAVSHFMGNQAPTLKEAFARTPGVVSVSVATDAPPEGMNTWSIRPLNAPADQTENVFWIGVDYDYLETLGLEVVAGRGFSEDFPADAQEAILLNEAAVDFFGLTDPVGQRFHVESGLMDSDEATVIGVVKNFHHTSLHDEIRPVFLIVKPLANRLLVNVRTERLPETLAFLKRAWESRVTDWPFVYTFLDDRFDALHRAEQRLGRLFTTFAGLAILVACLGLFGLAAFTAEQRTKEIGVRKVLGATVPSIVGLLSRQFAVLVLVAFVVATPVAYLAMSRWLADFAYRVDLSVGIFLLAGALALAVALVTVGYQAVKAALTDPVKALRYE